MKWDEFCAYMTKLGGDFDTLDGGDHCFQPVAKVRTVDAPNMRQGTGVAICLGENLSKLYQSGDVIIFWDNGDHGVFDGDHEVEVLEVLIGIEPDETPPQG